MILKKPAWSASIPVAEIRASTPVMASREMWPASVASFTAVEIAPFIAGAALKVMSSFPIAGIALKVLPMVSIAGVAVEVLPVVSIAGAAVKIWPVAALVRASLEIMARAAVISRPEIRSAFVAIWTVKAGVSPVSIRPAKIGPALMLAGAAKTGAFAIGASKVRPVLAGAHFVEIRAIAAHFRPGAIRAVWLGRRVAGHAETQYHCGCQREHCKSIHAHFSFYTGLPPNP